MPNIDYITIDEDAFLNNYICHFDNIITSVVSLPIREKRMEYDGERVHIDDITLLEFEDKLYEHDRIIDGHSLKEIFGYFRNEFEEAYNRGYEDAEARIAHPLRIVPEQGTHPVRIMINAPHTFDADRGQNLTDAGIITNPVQMTDLTTDLTTETVRQTQADNAWDGLLADMPF